MHTSTTINEPTYDIAIIGGGINGVGIAVDAAGRGLSVFLCEQDDLASHTSSASSKLIHGGLRYLEHKEFRLVRESLKEREILLSKAPHIIWPMRFVLPYRSHLRPIWLIRMGLFVYDHLAKREKLSGSKHVYFNQDSPFNSAITHGFEYSDCAVDDARLVILNAMQARELGATIVTQTRCLSAYRDNNQWAIELNSQQQGKYSIKAKALVNASGPWVAKFIKQELALKSPYEIRLIQGSHILVPKIYEGQNAFIMQNDDQRIVFAIPYLKHYTLIGTTDQEYSGDLNQVHITDQEIKYLLKICNDHFKVQLAASDIIHTYSGVRPLCDDESANPSVITRDYTLALNYEVANEAPLLSVFGGKLTTYRKLADSAMMQLHAFFPEMKSAWTEKALLPGAEGWTTHQDLITQIIQSVQGISQALAERWAYTYGTRVWALLKKIEVIDALGQNFGHDLYEQEVHYLVEHEWAQTSLDILMRRTKLYLEFSPKEIQSLDEYLIKLHQRRQQKDVA